MKKNWRDILYMVHVISVWVGLSSQIHLTYTSKSTEGLSTMLVICLLLSEFAALPRCFKSEFWVWKVCHVGAIILFIVLLVGVIIYG